VSDQGDKQEIANLERVNDDLTRSLKLCHSMLDDYRAKLAANSNDPELANEEDRDRNQA
jgi:hypothetical protein